MNYLHLLRQVYSQEEARALYMLVMEKQFGLSATQVLMGKDKELSAADSALLENIVQRLLRHEPVQYILGEADFCGHTFHVAPGVLIPRPETQDLVQLIQHRHPTPQQILDIGTGSGCIAISLALCGHHTCGMDISRDALRIAQHNAALLHAQTEWMQADILQCPAVERTWDVIVSNPPYICQSEAQQMERNVLEHEPREALFVADNDPLLFYRAITQWATAHLHSGGYLYFETNRAYARQVATLMETSGYRNTHVLDDRFGNPRFAFAQKP